MPTKSIVLTDRLARFVDRLVASGRYQNASEVLREGLRLVEHRDAEDKARLKALREAARAGIADIEGGRFCAFESTERSEHHLTSLTDGAVSPADELE
jgi:antitoxin ParD1/3/4